MGKDVELNRFNEVYEQFFLRVYRYIFSRIGNRSDTEDIVSEVFSALWEFRSHIPEDEIQCRNWVFSIATHKLNDHLRKLYKLRTNFSSVDVELFAAEIPEVSEQKRNPVANILLKKLDKIIATLNERERKFFQLRYRQSYKVAEIAQELDVSLNNAKVIQNRLIKKIKKLWTENNDENK